ncbi:hypothetical protein [Burkholderia cepacia]|uniref:hypothetical protein n=1 Tax=Burkholderia cepacia TaxID=292 RepID=UPI001CF3695F|nr:hypothetical protein [Burkholderia cepacia]MCA8026509.1 hypothetical protein [Burkholderia cepacia]
MFGESIILINVQKDLLEQIKMIYHRSMNLATYFRTTKPAERDEFAKALGSSVDYLYLCSRGTRQPGPKLCRKIVELDPRFTLPELRPDIWGAPADSVDASDDTQPPAGTSGGNVQD